MHKNFNINLKLAFFSFQEAFVRAMQFPCEYAAGIKDVMLAHVRESIIRQDNTRIET